MNAAEFQEQIEAFQAFNEAKGLSERTIATYRKLLRCFRQWLIEQYGTDAEITARRIRKFLAHKRAEGRAPSTIQTYWATLHAFFAFLVLDEVVPEAQDPMRLVKVPRVPAPEIQPLTQEEIKSLLGSFDQTKPTDYRNYIICLLILDTGLRVSEVRGLQLKDLNLVRSEISVRGKGGKGRTVYVGRKMLQLLTDYIERWQPLIARRNDVVFPPAKGSKNSMLERTYLSTIVRLKMDEVGISRNNSSCHRLRHTMAINYLRNGGDVFSLQKLLGHSTLEMTKRYCTLANEDVRQAHRKASPVDAMELCCPPQVGQGGLRQGEPRITPGGSPQPPRCDGVVAVTWQGGLRISKESALLDRSQHEKSSDLCQGIEGRASI